MNDMENETNNGADKSNANENNINEIKLLEDKTESSPYSSSNNAIATSFKSFAEGYNTVASGIAAHAEGTETIASGEWSHAEGSNTRAIGSCSHAEGTMTKAMGTASHVEGYESSSLGTAAHAEGIKTNASGYSAHSEGVDTIASGDFSHAEGKGTSTNWKVGSHIMGVYGDASSDYSWNLANGTSPTERGLAARIGRNGIASTDFYWVAGNSGYSELFETIDGNPIDPGYFVTLRGRKIQIATTQDRYILGVTTAAPGFLGSGGDLRWKDKYATDEWGRIKSQEVVVPALKDKNGNVIIPEHKERQPIINPNWKSDQPYVSRARRPEWVAVCLIGQVLVRDNGACKPNSYCIVSDQGMAVQAQRGYRVMERTGPNQILILLRSSSFSMKPGQDK